MSWFISKRYALCPWSFQCPVAQDRILCRACEGKPVPPPIFEKRIPADG